MAELRLCRAPDCCKPSHRGRYCGMHETRMRKHGSFDLPARPDRLAESIIGQRYGRLVGIAEANPVQTKAQIIRYFQFHCDCGTKKRIRAASVRSGAVSSCGCAAVERRRSLWKHSVTHGMSKTPIYRIYRTMLSRCYNAKVERFPIYGGRGIGVCDRWRDEGGFENFYADMGARPNGHSLDRINPDADYGPENCRWASAETQANNTRRNRRVTFDGRDQTLAEWSREIGIKPNLISLRLKAGWAVEDALFKPVKKLGTAPSYFEFSDGRRSGTAEYGAWVTMRGRCGNPDDKGYANYGGRGIEVCPEWEDDFEAFLAHVGARPDPSYSLDRIDNNKGYEPGNVRWADRVTQTQNRRPISR